jgi:hypothetical protein
VRRTTFQDTRTPAGARQDGGGFGLWKKGDDFQRLQEEAELEEESWHEAGEELEAEDARALWEALTKTRTTVGNFAPRRALAFMLGQVMAREEEVEYAQVLERVRALRFLVVMRPDGYLAWALDGEPLQRMGRIAVREGRWMAGRFEVGAFYWNKGGVFYTVDGALSRPGIMMGELGLERDWLNAALDGAGDAALEVAEALGQLLTSPVTTVKGLQQQSAAVAALIASSPEYFARYSTLPLQEQIREAARLSTHLLMLVGSAGGAATRLSATGARIPVLTLTAEGALAVEQVAVPVGTTAAALGAGAGAVYVQMGSGSGSEGGSGKADFRGFKPFTEDNFRENLARLTGKMPEDAHAHHVLPQKHAKRFGELGFNVQDPRFGVWWERTSHLKNANRYNAQWEEFLRGGAHFRAGSSVRPGAGTRVWIPSQLLETSPVSTRSSAWASREPAGRSEETST